MYVCTLKRMMIGRTIVQKGETVSVGVEEGKQLLEQGCVLAVKTPDPADSSSKPKVKKPEATEDKAD